MDPLTLDAERIASRMATLAIRAQVQLDHRDISDERTFQRGARHAYVTALAHTTTPEPHLSVAVHDTSERIIDALDGGVRDPRELLAIATNTPTPTSTTLTWLGVLAFGRRYSGRGVDEDLGMRCGRRRDVQIGLRRRSSEDTGHLYAHDPLWGEYAVLADPVTAVRATQAFHRAQDLDPRMEPAAFLGVLHAVDRVPGGGDRANELLP